MAKKIKQHRVAQFIGIGLAYGLQLFLALLIVAGILWAFTLILNILS